MGNTKRTGRRRPGMMLGVALVTVGLVAGACSSDEKSTTDSAAATTVASGGSTATTTGGAVTTPATTGSGDTTAPTTADTTDTTATTATTATTEPAKTPVSGGNLVMGVEAETSSPWRPAEMVCAISCHQIARAVYDSLALTGNDDKPHPYLASAIEPNADFTVWKITARAGIKFHDGTPLDGAAIVDNLNRHKVGLLTGVAIKSVTDISLDPADPMTAVVTVEKPWATFPFYLTGQVGYMASPTWLAASDADETLRSRPVGTGPFIFEDYKANEYFKAKKNPDYWNKPYPFLDSVEFIPIADALKRRDALKAGDVDLIHTTNGQSIVEFREDATNFPSIETQDKSETAYSLLHVTKEGSILTDQRVRCALAYAYDAKTVNDSINQGVNQLANGPFSPGQVGYLDDTGYPLTQDMAKAQELIKEYKADHPGEKLTLALATTNDATNLVVANFQKQWWEQAGIDEVTIDQIDQGNYIVTALLGTFEVFQWRNHGGVDLDQQYFWWHSSSALPVGSLALNFGRIKDAKLDALLDQNRASNDPTEKKQIAEDVNRLFASECYNLWGTWTVWMLAGKPGIEGLAGENLALPDGGKGQNGAGIAGSFFPATVWLDA
ncbi:MAG: ABC transporter substrate-binding protein [Ilumatobacteraceae bacterium]